MTPRKINAYVYSTRVTRYKNDSLEELLQELNLGSDIYVSCFKGATNPFSRRPKEKLLPSLLDSPVDRPKLATPEQAARYVSAQLNRVRLENVYWSTDFEKIVDRHNKEVKEYCDEITSTAAHFTKYSVNKYDYVFKGR